MICPFCGLRVEPPLPPEATFPLSPAAFSALKAEVTMAMRKHWRETCEYVAKAPPSSPTPLVADDEPVVEPGQPTPVAPRLSDPQQHAYLLKLVDAHGAIVGSRIIHIHNGGHVEPGSVREQDIVLDYYDLEEDTLFRHNAEQDVGRYVFGRLAIRFNIDCARALEATPRE